jgi:hypothetical protein
VLQQRHGKQPILSQHGGGDVDDMIFDSASKRIYASCGAGSGAAWIYQEQAADRYKLLGDVTTAPGAKNEVLVPQLGLYFTVAPPKRNPRGAVDVFRVEE